MPEVPLKRVFLRTGAMSGAFNMALDEHLLRLAGAGRIGFAFRLYGWSPACVSFGRLQKPSVEADLAAMASAGTDFVRRPTGGRAVWHEHEITYSVVASASHPMAGRAIGESLSMTGEAILRPLRALGVPAALSPAGRGDRPPRMVGNPCFTSHGTSEITVGGRKLVGSAQARSAGAFLEHGSILLLNDQLRLLPFLRMPPEARAALSAKLAEGTCCLADVSPGLDPAELCGSLLESFSELGGGELERASVEDMMDEGLSASVELRKMESEAWLAEVS